MTNLNYNNFQCCSKNVNWFFNSTYIFSLIFTMPLITYTYTEQSVGSVSV
jgi:hypothetical protein